MNNQGILLISHGHFEKDFLENLSREVTKEYLHPVSTAESHIDLSDFYDPKRRQYDANGILYEIRSTYSPDHLKRIGLFRVDLYIPILTYIFGQATLNGDTGIASLYRLRNENYGMPKDDNLMFRRFKKVIIHELGHTFGLLHCHIPKCVMRSSTYVEDLDQKNHMLCPGCREKLGAT